MERNEEKRKKEASPHPFTYVKVVSHKKSGIEANKTGNDDRINVSFKAAVFTFY